MSAAMASNLKRRVAIEQLVQTPDGAGGYSRSWSTLATVWAAVRSRRTGRLEDFTGTQLHDGHQYEVSMRYRSDVSADMRLQIDGQPYAIRSVQDVDAGNAMLRLLVEKERA